MVSDNTSTMARLVARKRKIRFMGVYSGLFQSGFDVHGQQALGLDGDMHDIALRVGLRWSLI
jgi:hypothetical protein